MLKSCNLLKSWKILKCQIYRIVSSLRVYQIYLETSEISRTWIFKGVQSKFEVMLSLKKLINLEVLHLWDCLRLEKLSNSFEGLQNLENLNLQGVESKEYLIESFGKLSNQKCWVYGIVVSSWSYSIHLETFKIRKTWILDTIECKVYWIFWKVEQFVELPVFCEGLQN